MHASAVLPRAAAWVESLPAPQQVLGVPVRRRETDFAEFSPGRCTPARCHPPAAAPEQLLGQRCTLAADVYSFGILLIELLTQTHWDVRGQWRLPRAPEECPTVRPRRFAWVCQATQCGACTCTPARPARTCRLCFGLGVLCTVLPAVQFTTPCPFPVAMQGVVTLIQDCILSDPSQRPSAAEALARLYAAAPAEPQATPAGAHSVRQGC